MTFARVTLLFALALVGFAVPAKAQSSRFKPIANAKIFFDFNAANVSKSALDVVDLVVEVFKARQPIFIEVEGHTDMSADELADKNLALARADGIRDALVAKGLPRVAISTLDMGISQPLVKTAKGTREPLNRRVEVTLYAFSNIPIAPGSKKPTPECLDYQSRGDRHFMRNTCKAAINVQIYDRDRKSVIEHELKPSQEAPAVSGFGAVCPAGHQSDFTLTVEEQAVFSRDAYYCIRKSGGLH